MTWTGGLGNNMTLGHIGSTGYLDFRQEMKFRNHSGIEYIRLYDYGTWLGKLTMNIDAYNDNNGLGTDGGDTAMAVDGDWLQAAIRHAGPLVNVSDRRVKTQILPIDDAIDKVKGIVGSTYYRLNNPYRQAGVIAQDVQAVLPEAVIEDDETNLAVDFDAVTGLLVQAIKEQQTMIEALTLRIETLEDTNI